MNELHKKIVSIVEVIVFDMDGTLYQLDGDNGTVMNSTLMHTVIDRSVDFVISKENCKRAVAEKLVAFGMADEVGISNILSKRYGITREDYFNIVWDFDPQGIIKDYEISVKVVKKLHESNKKLILLTSAPHIWMENVLEMISLSTYFDKKFSGEMFRFKREVFEQLIADFDPKKLLSVGDQVETDINPAKSLGMYTVKINSPKDLEDLI